MKLISNIFKKRYESLKKKPLITIENAKFEIF